MSTAAQNRLAPESLLEDSKAADLAFAALEELAFNREGAKARFSGWFCLIQHQQALGRPLSVLEHTALAYSLRSGFLNAKDDSSLIRNVSQALAGSWREFSGDVPKDLLARLPRKTLRGASHEVRLFHAAAFESSTRGTGTDTATLSSLLRDYPGDARDLLAVMALIAVGLSPTGRQLLAGTALGYVTATVLEYGFHGYLAHAPNRVNRFFKKIGGSIEKAFVELKYSHAVIHHAKTFREKYNVQFSTLDEKEAVERLAHARGEAGLDIIDSRFGNSMSLRGLLKGLKVGLPFALLLTASAHLTARALGLHPSAIFDVTAILVSMINLPATGFFHPYMHMTRKQAQDEASPLMRWFLKTRYTAMMSRLHYGHHRGRGGNHNLVFGADFLFGTLKKPNVRQMLEMKKLDLIY